MANAMQNGNNGGGGGGGGARGALVPPPGPGFKWKIEYVRVKGDNAARIAELVAQGFQPAPVRGVQTRSVSRGMVTYFRATKVLKKIGAPKVKKVIIDERQMFSMADLAAALDADANNAEDAGGGGGGGGT